MDHSGTILENCSNCVGFNYYRFLYYINIFTNINHHTILIVINTKAGMLSFIVVFKQNCTQTGHTGFKTGLKVLIHIVLALLVSVDVSTYTSILTR